MRTVLLVLLLLVPAGAFAHTGHQHYTTTDYISQWCIEQGGQFNTVVDGYRFDCVTETHAIRAVEATRWGVALNSLSSLQITKAKGILVFLRHPDDYLSLGSLLKKLPSDIAIWTVDKSNLPIEEQ